MSLPSPWQELFEKAYPTGSVHDQADALERVASLADYQNYRLSTGVSAISELLDGAASADQMDDVLAMHICSLLAAIAGLSIQLAAMSRDANKKLAAINALVRPSPLTINSPPPSQE